MKKGKIAAPVRRFAYQSNSITFWNSCDMLGGPRTWEMGGSIYDGKGEPRSDQRDEPRLPGGALSRGQRARHEEGSGVVIDRKELETIAARLTDEAKKAAPSADVS